MKIIDFLILVRVYKNSPVINYLRACAPARLRACAPSFFLLFFCALRQNQKKRKRAE
jgi:hypothetical protein